MMISFNMVSEESKQIYLEAIERLKTEQNIDGIALGCTGKNTISTVQIYEKKFNCFCLGCLQKYHC